MFGAGLQLQQATPGTANVGNFNLDGVGIAGRFSTHTGGFQSELFGHNLVCPGDNASNVLVGANLTTDTGNTGTYVIFGSSCRASGQGNVALGIGCLSGPSPATGFANNVTVGKDCSAGTTAADGGNRIAMGYQCSASGSMNVAVGKTVNLTNTNAAGGELVGFGAEISCGINAKSNVLLGYNITPVSRTNVLSVGNFSASVGSYPGAGAGQQDNSILLGNSLQTLAKIGQFSLTKPTITGSRGGNAALASLLSALAADNLIVDSTTA